MDYECADSSPYLPLFGAKPKADPPVSHELRTPQNPALLLASDSTAAPQLHGDVRDVFAMIEKSVRVEARRIDDLLDLAKSAQGNPDLEAQPVEIHSVLRNAIELIEPDASFKRIGLSLGLQAGPACIGTTGTPGAGPLGPPDDCR